MNDNVPQEKEKVLELKQFLIYLVTNPERQISDVVTEMRALQGVVTISIFEATRNLSDFKQLTKIKLKYLQVSDNLVENIKFLKKQILSVKGVISIVLKIKKTEIQNSGETINNKEG